MLNKILSRFSMLLTLTLVILITTQQPAFGQSKLVWTDNKANTIESSNLDGSNRKTLISGVSTALGIAIDPVAKKMYWTDRDTGLIQRANLDGSSVTTLLTLNFEKRPGDIRPLSPTGLALHLLGDTAPPPAVEPPPHWWRWQ